MRLKLVCGIVAGVVLASWLGNYGYYRYNRLPEAGFLRHYIETTEIPSVAFDLLYVANNDDKVKPVNVRIDAMPELRFYPVQVHQEMHRQTIYMLTGYYDANAMTARTAAEPLRLHTVTVTYSDGSVRDEDIGEIVVYRVAWPIDSSSEAPVGMLSAGGSTNGDGYASVQANRPVRLMGVSSAWLDELGDAFEYELKPSPSALPMELEKGQMLRLEYQFHRVDPMTVYSVQLKENFKDTDGETYSYTVFANEVPRPTEAEMRAYVQDRRREKG